MRIVFGLFWLYDSDFGANLIMESSACTHARFIGGAIKGSLRTVESRWLEYHWPLALLVNGKVGRGGHDLPCHVPIILLSPKALIDIGFWNLIIL